MRPPGPCPIRPSSAASPTVRRSKRTLFDAFIPAAYRSSAEGRWTAGQAERWLAFLARHLEQTIGTPDLAWWQLEKAVSRTALILVAGLAAWLAVGRAPGLVIGLAAGLVVGLNKTRWTSYTLARRWLAFRRQLPWPLMAFLADAHQRGVLRQAGATYQFRHLEPQHRLATRS